MVSIANNSILAAGVRRLRKSSDAEQQPQHQLRGTALANDEAYQY
jgi:hypothetical protein